MAQKVAEVTVESKVRMLPSRDIQHGQDVLVAGAAKPTPELLQEHGRALRGSEEEKRVHVRDVDALVEEIDDTQRAHLAAGEVSLRTIALLAWRVIGERAS